MTTSRLTVDLPETDIHFLKQFARKNNTTVSQLIDSWVKGLRKKPKPGIHPDIKKFTGIIPPDADVDEAITDYVLEKHK